MEYLIFSQVNVDIIVSMQEWVIIIAYHQRVIPVSQGGSHTDMVYVYVPAFWAPFHEIWYSDQGVFIRDEGAQIT